MLKYPHNLFDAFKERADDGSESTGIFLFRLAWDVGFQIFFVYILLSIVTGIIIDAFSLLKFERDAEITDLASICFVCNIRRFRVDQKGIGFDKHIKTEHNPMFYLYFLIHLQNTPDILLTGQERYVANKVTFGNKAKKDIGWLPREETFSMRKDEEEVLQEEETEDIRQIMDKVLQIDDKVDQLALHVSTSLETISRQILALSQQQHPQQPALSRSVRDREGGRAQRCAAVSTNTPCDVTGHRERVQITQDEGRGTLMKTRALLIDSDIHHCQGYRNCTHQSQPLP
jgi:hypothetical protein